MAGDGKADDKRAAKAQASNLAIVAKIEQLEEEEGRLAKEKKRVREDIEAYYALLKKRIKNPNQEELDLEVVAGGAASGG